MIQQVSRCLGVVHTGSSLLCSSLLLAGEVVSCYMYIGNLMFWYTGTHVLVLYMWYTDYYYMYHLYTVGRWYVVHI